MNSVFLIGRLTADPQLRQVNNGVSMVNFTLAVQRPPSKNNDHQADFINVIVFGVQAENLVKYKKKGSLIAVEGRLQTRRWEDKNGKKHSVMEVVANRIMFLSFDGAKNDKEDNNKVVSFPVDNDEDLPF